MPISIKESRRILDKHLEEAHYLVYGGNCPDSIIQDFNPLREKCCGIYDNSRRVCMNCPKERPENLNSFPKGTDFFKITRKLKKG